MKPVTLLLALIFLITPVCNAFGVPLGERAPDFSLVSSEGEVASKSKFREKVLVMIFWRTDQKRSLLALEDASELLEKYKGKGMRVLTIIQGSDNLEEAKKIMSENNINLPLYVDKDREAYSDFGVRVFPTTIAIDKEGVITYDIASHPVSYKIKLQGYVRKLLGEITEDEMKSAISPGKKVKDEATLEATRRYNLALKFIEMRLPDQAIDAAIKSVEAKPDMVKSIILLGFLYLNGNEAEKALDTFEKALKIEPGSNDARTGKGGALVLKGEADRAIEILSEAAAANPYPQMTYYELGKAYELKSDKEKAMEMYKKAIEKIVQKKILPSSVSKCQ
jgi:tetratricopeptide (TPR) repeat protein